MNIMNAGQLYQSLKDSGVINADTSGVHLPSGMILGEVQIDTDGANGRPGDYSSSRRC